MNDHRNNRRGGAAILLLIAAFSLLLTFAFLAPRPDAVAMQVGQTVRSTPSLTVISPLQPPTVTGIPIATRRPTQTPQSLIWITDATEAWVLIHRPGFSGRSDAGADATAASVVTHIPNSQVKNVDSSLHLYLPLVHTHWTSWGKGVGKHVPNATPPLIPTPGPDVSPLNLNWYYNWSYKVTPSPLETRSFVPMVWCAGKPSDGVGANHIDTAKLQELAAAYPGRVWLVFNEPDHPATLNSGVYSYGQCAEWLCKIVRQQNPQYPCAWGGNSGTPTPNPTVQATLQAKMAELAADRFAEVSDIIKTADPSARLFCCGNFFDHNTDWWEDFKEQLRTQHSGVKIDGVAIHVYPWTRSTNCNYNYDVSEIWGCLQGDLEGFTAAHAAELARTDSVLASGAPLWITEYGYLNYNGPTATPGTPTADQIVNYVMMPMVNWFQTGPSGYQAVAWYVTIDQSAYTPEGTNLFYVTSSGTYALTTPAGTTWAGVVPATATSAP